MSALLVLLVLVAYALPDRHLVERSKVIAASPEQIWPLLAEPRQWSRWSPWHVRDPQMLLGYSGPVSGQGAQWSWVSDTLGRGRMRFDEVQPPNRLGYAVVFDDPAWTARGEFRLDAVVGGTRVTWSLESTVGANVLLRWLSLLADIRLGRDVEVALDRLAAVVRQS
ncbi:MAG: SRPBCC family protein [Sphaerotilus sp.]|nr:SRPBCC family protein [Sphaerotilus sp.]